MTPQIKPSDEMIERLRSAAKDKGLSIGQAWELIDQAADYLSTLPQGREAALEEAAQIAEASDQDRHALGIFQGVEIARAIRALKSVTPQVEQRKEGEANSPGQRLPESNLGHDNAQPPSVMAGAQSTRLDEIAEEFVQGAFKGMLPPDHLTKNYTPIIRELLDHAVAASQLTDRDGSKLSDSVEVIAQKIDQAAFEMLDDERRHVARAKARAIIDRLTGGKS